MREWQGLAVSELPGFTGFVPPEGDGTSGVMIVGEAPGEMEAKFSVPFYAGAPAGSMLNRIIARCGLEREKFTVINTVWSRPPGNWLDGAPYEGQAIAAYKPFLQKAFELYRPRVLVAMGGTALRALTDYGNAGVGITKVQGYVLDGPWSGTYVIPCLHPSAIVRGEQRMTGVVIWALQRAIEIAKHGFVRTRHSYLTHPSVADALAFEAGYQPDHHILSYDIETAESANLDEEEVEGEGEKVSYNITRLSLCYEKEGAAITVPWQNPYTEIAKRMLSSPGPKRVWNCPTPDQKVLTANLHWIQAGALQVGDKLVGFDEEVTDGRKIRRYKEAVVTHAERGTALVYEVTLSDGTKVKTTGEHPWLRCSRQGKGPHTERNSGWVLTKNLGVGSPIRRLFNPWQSDYSYESGVLSGFFDGEGHLAATADKGEPKSLSVGAAQNEGITLNRVCDFIRNRGFRFNIYSTGRKRDEKIRHIRIAGGACETARFLGTVRPIRLLDKFRPSLLGAVWGRTTPWLIVTAIKPLGTQEIVRLSTSTYTYVLDGFGAHNSNFDNPRLAAAGASVAGRNYDVMWAWKHLQPTLPRNLGFVAPFYNWSGEPWKHTSDYEMERYSCQDALALQMIGDGVDAHLKAKGQWDVYERHVVDLTEVLQQMSKNGLPYKMFCEPCRIEAGKNCEGCATGFEVELQGRWDKALADLQLLVPESLKPSKQKSGLKMEPKSLEGLTQRRFKVLVTDLSQQEWKRLDMPGSPKDVDEPFTIVEALRWCKLEPFNPGSPGEGGQVAQLIKHYGHKLGRNHKTKKGSVDDDTLKKLSIKCRNSRKPADQELAGILRLVRECRQYSKIMGTYVKGWRPGADGRIHATPGFWGSMYRISWRRPNISATVQDKQDSTDEFEVAVAQGFRKCVAAGPGQVLIEADWKSMEAVLVAYFAGDQDYDRLARLGVHDYLTCHLLVERRKMAAADLPDLAWSNSDLKAVFKRIKAAYPKDRDDAKHCIHGISYGMGPFLMAETYEMPLREAKRLIDLFFALFPKIKAWQEATLARASRECKLRNPFSYEMPFWEVYKWDGRKKGANGKPGSWSLGSDAKSAIAFLPRDTGAAMLKEALLRIAPRTLPGELVASTHDSVLCDVRAGRLDTVAGILQQELERPVPELGGLSIPVELKQGPCWHESAMDPYEVPRLVTI
jgi:uracil-DNA glycosylase family 4